MKSLAIAAVLALVGFASLAAPASAAHYGSYRAPSCNTGGWSGGGNHNHGGGGHVRVGRGRGNSWSNWNRGGHDHNHGHNQGRGGNNFYYGNRDFSFGIRF